MPQSSSSPSPTIIPMNPITKPQTLALPNPIDYPDDPFLPSLLMDDPNNPNGHHPRFSSLLFRDEDEDEDEDDDDADEPEEDKKPTATAPAPAADDSPRPYVDPAPHISSQFYTFNSESHALMVRCILEGRLATPDEIRAATPRTVLRSWRSVWKDRNEDTAYLTAWKRIQDKLSARLIEGGPEAALHFKSNPAHRVSHVGQWHDIVTAAHADADLRHLGMRETVDRIKQNWTVGAKFYGIPESFIRVCVASCPVCSCSGGSGGPSLGSRTKRRRFEYTESFDVPACEVQRRLQQLAAKHKVVLCIRQKYIRYKPFMAEVKDYACHRAGEPTSASNSSKKARVLKREPYVSKRCGCGFRIRAIVPIANYNEKDKTFVYQEEGTAVFKLYAVHSGHEPGPLDGSARIIHRLVGHKGGFDPDPEVYGVREDMESESFVSLLGKDDGNGPQLAVFQQVQELRTEVGLLEGKITKMPQEQLSSLSHELLDILNRLRSVGELQQLEEPLAMGDGEVGHWGDDHDHHLDGDDRIFDKDVEIIEDDNEFDPTLSAIVPWDRMETECQERKVLMRDSCKSDKWLMKEDFDERSILNCGEDEAEECKLIKPIQHNGGMVSDPNLVGMQIAGFYTDNTKWYDSPSGLDPGGDTSDGGFRHGRIV